MELPQFLLFCKHFEIPLSSKALLTVHRKVIEQSETGSFLRQDCNEALKLIFTEVHRQKVAGLELLYRKRIKQLGIEATKNA